MFQFGLRSLLAVTVAAAVLFCLVFTLPDAMGQALLACLQKLMVPVCVAGIVYSPGPGRAFCIGGLAWVGARWLSVTDEYQYLAMQMNGAMMSPAGMKRELLLQLALTLFSGVIAVIVRHVALSTQRKASPAEAADLPPVSWPQGLAPVCGLALICLGLVGWLDYRTFVETGVHPWVQTAGSAYPTASYSTTTYGYPVTTAPSLPTPSVMTDSVQVTAEPDLQPTDPQKAAPN